MKKIVFCFLFLSISSFASKPPAGVWIGTMKDDTGIHKLYFKIAKDGTFTGVLSVNREYVNGTSAMFYRSVSDGRFQGNHIHFRYLDGVWVYDGSIDHQSSTELNISGRAEFVLVNIDKENIPIHLQREKKRSL